MDLRSTQLKDTYGNLVTTGTTEGAPTTGGLQNGQGTLLTSVGINTNSPAKALHIYDSAVNKTAQLKLSDGSSDTSAYIGSFANTMWLTNGGTFASGWSLDGAYGIGVIEIGSIDGGSLIRLNTASSNTTSTERMKVHSSGDISFRDGSANEAFYWDASAGSLGLGTTSPSYKLTINTSDEDHIRLENGSEIGIIQLTDNGILNFWAHGDDANNEITFTNGTGSGTERMRIDSSGNVTLQTVGAQLRFQNSAGPAPYIENSGEDASTAPYGQDLLFATGGSESMRIDSSGNVGINDTNPVNGYLTIRGATTTGTKNGHIMLTGDSATNGQGPQIVFSESGVTSNFAGASVGYVRTGSNGIGDLVFGTRATSGDADTVPTERMRIDSSGNVGLGVTPSAFDGLIKAFETSGGSLYTYAGLNLGLAQNAFFDGAWKYKTTAGASLYYQASSAHNWSIAPSGTAGNAITFTPAMTLDASGNLLVGKTSANLDTVGAELRANGIVSGTVSDGNVLWLNRTTSDGNIAIFSKDGATVGSIGSVLEDSLSRLYIAQSDTGLKFNNGPDYIVPCTSAGADRDNVIDLGSSSARFTDIYATNATIQTSDVNEKQDIEELDDAELRVAQKAKTLLRKYRWKSSVEEKGDEARIHFGIIAQDLEQAFIDEGLDAGRYGMFIKSTWTNEDGEEQTRLGVRYNQLLAFIISAL